MAKKGKGGRRKSDDISGVASPEQWAVSAFGGGSATTSGIRVSPDRALANPTIGACVRILSEDVAKLPLGMYEGRRRGTARKEVTSHPTIQALQYRPNGWQTPFEYMRFHQMNYLLEGNHYDFQLRNERGDLLEVIPIPRGRVTIYQATDGELFYGVARSSTHEMAVLKDEPLMIPSEYMLHDRGPTRDSIYGQSVIGWHREAIGLALAGEDHASRTFSAGARPSGVLQHPKSLSDPARKRLKGEFDDYRGQAGALKTLLLEEGLVFNPVTMSNVDVQFIESRKFQVEEIARMFGIPRHKLGEEDTSRGSTVEMQEQAYVNSTLLAHCERMESLLDTRLLTPDEWGKFFFEFDLTQLVRGDMKSRFDAYAIARQWGWFSVNDILVRENLNPVGPAGDIRLQPLNMAPLGTPPTPAAAATVPGAPGTTAPGTQPPGSDPPPAGNPEPKKGNGHTTWPE